LKSLPHLSFSLSVQFFRFGTVMPDMMSSQIIAIAGTQRGGKGTLAAILATLSGVKLRKLSPRAK